MLRWAGPGERRDRTADAARKRFADLHFFFNELWSQRVGVETVEPDRVVIHAVRNPFGRSRDVPVTRCTARMGRSRLIKSANGDGGKRTRLTARHNSKHDKAPGTTKDSGKNH